MTEAPWRFKVQTAAGLFVAILVTGAGIVLIYFDLRNSAALRTYQSAATCTAPADALTGEGCRYLGSATVVGRSRPNVLTIDVTFAELPGHSFTTTFSDRDEPSSEAVAIGTSAPAELWGGRVTRFADVATLDSPEKLPMNLATSGWIAAVFGLTLVVWTTILARRAWRRQTSSTVIG